MQHTFNKALIVGAGSGLSASLARYFSSKQLQVSLAARNIEKLVDLCDEIDARSFSCDAASPDSVSQLFAMLDRQDCTPELVIYNPSFRVRGELTNLDIDDVKKSLDVTAFGAFLVAQQAVKRMQKAGKGCIVFTGASAGVKGYAQSAPFAMGKFALRGLAQSMAREFHPQGIHIAHVVVDGGIWHEARYDTADHNADALLDPDAIASTYWQLITQDRSIWSWEIELRPWVETF